MKANGGHPQYRMSLISYKIQAKQVIILLAVLLGFGFAIYEMILGSVFIQFIIRKGKRDAYRTCIKII
jgi:hypothetical protein